MEPYGNDWMRDEEKWLFLEQIKNYQRYPPKKEMLECDDKIRKLEIEVHNKLGLSYGKTLSAVSYFVKSALGKFTKKKKWSLEIWLIENKSMEDPAIICGAALIRHKKNIIYAKKRGEDLHDAIRKSVGAIEKSICRERSHWVSLRIYIFGR